MICILAKCPDLRVILWDLLSAKVYKETKKKKNISHLFFVRRRKWFHSWKKRQKIEKERLQRSQTDQIKLKIVVKWASNAFRMNEFCFFLCFFIIAALLLPFRWQLIIIFFYFSFFVYCKINCTSLLSRFSIFSEFVASDQNIVVNSLLSCCFDCLF